MWNREGGHGVDGIRGVEWMGVGRAVVWYNGLGWNVRKVSWGVGKVKWYVGRVVCGVRSWNEGQWGRAVV